MKEQYYIIDTELDSKQVYGPFASPHKACEWLRKDCRDLFVSSDISVVDALDGTRWASPYLIVKCVSVVEPVPILSARIKIRTVKNGGAE
jgi:hypothetical protein